MNVVARDVVDCLEVFVVDEWVMNVVARDVVDCLEVFVPLPGALSTVEPATRVHAVNSFDVRLLAVAFAFAFFCLSWLSCRTGGGRARPPPAAPAPPARRPAPRRAPPAPPRPPRAPPPGAPPGAPPPP